MKLQAYKSVIENDADRERDFAGEIQSVNQHGDLLRKQDGEANQKKKKAVKFSSRLSKSADKFKQNNFKAASAHKANHFRGKR